MLADNLHRAAELARARGFDPVLHFHAGSYVETADEIHAVMERLDTALVGMCARGYTGWLVVKQDRFLTPADTADVLLALHTRNRAWLRAQGF